LTLSPEDGTSNETVTIPSVGVGKVLQVVNVPYNIQLQTTSTGWSNAISGSITPKSATSRLYVQFSTSYFIDAQEESYLIIADITNNIDYTDFYKLRQELWTSCVISGSYASNNTSTRTIAVKARKYSGASTFYLGTGGTNCGLMTITEVEVAA
jgi:hypothetical protein